MTVYADDWIRPDMAAGSHVIRQGPEAASQTFTRGSPLVESSGNLKEATSGAVTDIVGFAAEAGHNDSSAGDHDVSYFPTDIHKCFQGNLSGASSPHTLAQANVFTEYGLAKNASGYWFVDADESSASQKCVTVTGLIDAVGDTDGKVRFALNKAGDPYAD